MSRITTEKGLQHALHDVMHNVDDERCCWKQQDAFTQGNPDQLFCVRGKVTFVELKHVPTEKIDKRGMFDPKVRPAQYSRAYEWDTCQGDVYFLISVGPHDALAEATMFVFTVRGVPRPGERVDVPALRARSIWEAPLDRPNLRRFGSRFLGLPATV